MTRRSFTLLEVVVGLALLATLGAGLLKLQTDAARQVRHARLRSKVTERVEQLLWQWSRDGTPVTLPATGEFEATLHWRREAKPVRIANGLLPTQIRLVVTHQAPNEHPVEIYRVAWLVPRKSGEQRP